MRARKVFTAIDTHTEGMPTRIVTSGFPPLPGDTMLQRSQHVANQLDGWRRLLMYEPRGHQAMSGAILTPPIRPDADLGVVYIEVTGCLPMCGHGTIGVVTAAIETGLVDVREPVTTVRLDTPAGLVVATAQVQDGRCRSVTLTNVPSFLAIADAVLTVPVGTSGTTAITVDVAYGGNFYVICPVSAVGLSIGSTHSGALIERGLAVMHAANEQLDIVHPVQSDIRGTNHTLFTDAPQTSPVGLTAAGTVVIHPGYLDRSPCGTGTSARMAQMQGRGDLDLGQPLIHTSITGSAFTGRIVETSSVGPIDAVVPTITGRAWITALNQLMLDPDDPYPEGFLIS